MSNRSAVPPMGMRPDRSAGTTSGASARLTAALRPVLLNGEPQPATEGAAARAIESVETGPSTWTGIPVAGSMTTFPLLPLGRLGRRPRGPSHPDGVVDAERACRRAANPDEVDRARHGVELGWPCASCTQTRLEPAALRAEDGRVDGCACPVPVVAAARRGPG